MIVNTFCVYPSDSLAMLIKRKTTEKGVAMMEEKQYWNQFIRTGKIADYLRYRENVVSNCNMPVEKGKSEHEGNDNTYRDDSGGISHERV